MNENLTDLSYRAGFIGDSMYPIVGTTQETALKNFAELIIRECIALIPEDCQAENGCHVSWVLAEHFGVKL